MKKRWTAIILTAALLACMGLTALADTGTASYKDTLPHTYVGEGAYNGTWVRAEAKIHATGGELLLMADGDAFGLPDRNHQRMLRVTDDDGNEYGFVPANPDGDSRELLEYLYEGGGGLPERLRIELAVTGGEDGAEEFSEPIIMSLTAVGDMETQVQEIGGILAVITGGRYDGRSLSVEYSIRTAGGSGRYEPTEEQLARAFKLPDAPDKAIDVWLDDADEAVVAEFKAACARGESYAVIQRYVYAQTDAVTADGLPLEDGEESILGVYSGRQYAKRTFTIPEAAQDREYLTVAITLVQDGNCLYFDGKDMYLAPVKNQECGYMTATFLNSAAD